MLRALTLAFSLIAAPAFATVVDTSAGQVKISAVVTGLVEPWGVAFLPDGAILVTERGGRLLRVDGGLPQEVSGGPQVRAAGQGGLLDVLVPRDFADTREVWLSYATGTRAGAATAIGRGRLSADGARLEQFETLWSGDVASGGRHFGARLAEAPDGTIWLGTGDRGTGPRGMAAQDPASSIGKVLAFRRDGTPLPAAGPGWAPGVQSLGHRNVQGLGFDRQGRLWSAEHGARGGDEVNLIAPGLNHGWPIISHGTDYDGSAIGTGAEAPGMEQPAHMWDPSIAPSGLAAYDASLIPQWRGSLFVGSLKFDLIARLDPARGMAEERIEAPETARVRDVRQGPDGALWFLSVGNGALYRMAPI
ncbi:MAG: PQQ-dependent sugar dehydrogenase [Gemmobacter sp.]|nr:PQQ-dependent sugar dehydrogenase [Gemmobacter sp.]